jgi:hypothetical protein
MRDSRELNTKVIHCDTVNTPATLHRTRNAYFTHGSVCAAPRRLVQLACAVPDDGECSHTVKHAHCLVQHAAEQAAWCNDRGMINLDRGEREKVQAKTISEPKGLEIL